MLEERVFALGSGCTKKNEPGNRFGARGEVWRDDGSFTVADDADSGGIDVLACFEIADGSLAVGSEVERGGGVGVAGGLGCAALVVAKNGNALSG